MVKIVFGIYGPAMNVAFDCDMALAMWLPEK